MRYRLMASYLGASYQAAVGPSDHDVTLFAAPPPPEEHGFSPAPGGIWRKQVRLDDLGALWESRPIGSYHDEPCLVLDDLGDRLHIVYLGMDEQRAAQLGYWEVDRGVFEVVVPRHDVTDLAEERHEFPIALLLSALPRALGAGAPGGAGPGFGQNGTPIAAGATGPGGVAGWTGPGAPQPARGQLPADGSAAGQQAQVQQAPVQQAPVQQAQVQQARPQQAQLPAARTQPPAGPGQQYPMAGQYQLPPGQPAPGGQQFAGTGAGPGTPYASAGQPGGAAPQAGAPGFPGAQPPAMGQGQPLAGPMPPPPGRPQLPMAQPPAGAQQQQLAQQFSPPTMLPAPQAPGAGMHQPPAAQFAAAQPGPAQSMSSQSGPAQSMSAQPPPAQSMSAQPPQPAAPQPPAPQEAAPQGPAPTAAAAWHGSPAAEGNGTWYFQPAPEAQPGGATGGYPANGMPQNGYAPPDQGATPGGPAGMQQYGQPLPASPAAGYQQPRPAAAERPPAAQPVPPAQLATLPPVAQQAPAAPAPQFLSQAPPPAQQAPFPVAPPAGPASLAEPATAGPPGGFAPPPPAMPPVRPAIPPVTAVPVADPPVTLPPPGPAPVPVLLAAPPMPAAPVPTAPPAPSAAPAAALTPADARRTDPLGSLVPPPEQQPSSGPSTVGALGKLTGAVRGRRALRKPRLAMSAIFADLVDMADIPRSGYAVDEEVTGAMCLFKTDGGYEVFSCAEDARHEVRFFEEEEAAYFYLFGVLAAEALRNGRLSPRRG